MVLPIFLSIFLSTCRGAEPESIRGIDGVLYKPFALADKKALVLLFVTHDCPIANGYAPEINRICAMYEPKGVSIFIVQVDPTLSVEDAKKHAHDYGFICPVLLDREHSMVKKVEAITTPEAAVLSPEGILLYRGRIDDTYVDFGKARLVPVKRDLREALDAILAGNVTPRPFTPAIGCVIQDFQTGVQK